MLKLKRFRTQNFRSIEDSGWTDLEKVTAFVGINESGKSNLLLSLWKLNPARDGDISLLQDIPRTRYSTLRDQAQKPIFISAVFDANEEVRAHLAELTGLDQANFDEVLVSRDLNGQYSYEFPNCQVENKIPSAEFVAILNQGEKELAGIEPGEGEGDLKLAMQAAIEGARDNFQPEEADLAIFNAAMKTLGIDRSAEIEGSKIGAIYTDIITKLKGLRTRLNQAEPTGIKAVMQYIRGKLPKFVYYSNYGNLDSEIFLPNVLNNLEREEAGEVLGEKEAAKSRTLKVLFDFVSLDPKEIADLGDESDEAELTDEQIEQEAHNKKEREVLLTSASGELTRKFRAWWKQGDYRFRFQADGRYFRIWVSDDIRAEEIELEGRSTGLQWFFSFYLVFLVESQGDHDDAILLLDEAGLSLHPLAQQDLSNFFESLPNQIVYTTHSPFLVEHDKLNEVRSVFLDENGRTSITADLRANPRLETSKKSIYAVHVSMGLSVSDTFLLGCLPVIVEGISDQRYLTTIKNYLIGKDKINPPKEIVFLPAGGAGSRGITATVSIVAAREEDLPFVILDSDGNGQNLRASLRNNTYAAHQERVKLVGEYIEMENCEIEDLIPGDVLASVISRYLPRSAGVDQEFEDFYASGTPIIPQVETYCREHEIDLKAGWKVEVSTMFMGRFDKFNFDDDTDALWTRLFEEILANG